MAAPMPFRPTILSSARRHTTESPSARTPFARNFGRAVCVTPGGFHSIRQRDACSSPTSDRTADPARADLPARRVEERLRLLGVELVVLLDLLRVRLVGRGDRAVHREGVAEEELVCDRLAVDRV